MPDSTNSTDQGLNSRVFRVMAATTIIAAAVSVFIAPWRVSLGLLVGGLLALFSHSWLKNSAAAAIRLSANGGVADFRVIQFLLRYVVIAAVIFSAHMLDLVSLPAVLAGMSSFVVALMAEAIREFYFAIKHREEIS